MLVSKLKLFIDESQYFFKGNVRDSKEIFQEIMGIEMNL